MEIVRDFASFFLCVPSSRSSTTATATNRPIVPLSPVSLRERMIDGRIWVGITSRVCTVCPYEMGWQQNLSLDTTQPGLGVRSVFGFFFPFSSFASPDRVDPSDTACLRW